MSLNEAGDVDRRESRGQFRKRARKSGAETRAICERVAHAVSQWMRVPVAAIMGGGRRARAVRARQIAMYLANVAFGVGMTDVGRVFARDRTTVVHACHKVEDERDDADFDRRLDRIEASFRSEAGQHVQ